MTSPDLKERETDDLEKNDKFQSRRCCIVAATANRVRIDSQEHTMLDGDIYAKGETLEDCEPAGLSRRGVE